MGLSARMEPKMEDIITLKLSHCQCAWSPDEGQKHHKACIEVPLMRMEPKMKESSILDRIICVHYVYTVAIY